MRATRAGAFVMALLTAACGQKTTVLTEQENRVVTETITELKTHCVGRYLIDLPGNMRSVGFAKLQGVMVKAEPKSLEQFNRDMKLRETELKATKSPAGYQFLYDSGKIHNVERGQYFVSLGNPFSSSDATRVTEAYKWDHGYQIALSTVGSDWTNSRFKDEPLIKNDPDKNNLPQKKRLAFDLIGKLQGRPEDVIPTVPGVCFIGGFLPGKAVSVDEEIQADFVMPDKPDVDFNVETFANLKVNDTLPQRMKGEEVREAMKAADGRLIRMGSFDLAGGITADEALVAALTLATPSVPGHQFSLEANYKGGALTPYLLLGMNTGSPNFVAQADSIKKASLTEGEAVSLWDAVSRTLRPRPNGF